jgi:CHAT domain-containing protein
VLGEAATETAIKAMSADDRLARARVVHFATHGLIAGEVKGLAEPALVLTPPAEGTDAAALEKDDGLLTASEVAQLKLNADWVILSACNTAAGDGGDGEALSGLARAFFYAGARALLVSHWPVNSEAAVKLTTRIFAQKADIGRAEALRQAMLATIAEGGRSAHPSHWAPFVVVGEGGR